MKMLIIRAWQKKPYKKANEMTKKEAAHKIQGMYVLHVVLVATVVT